MIKWRTEKVRPTYVPTFCVGLDGMCRVLLGRCCRLIEDAVSTIYRAFIFRSAVAPHPHQALGLPRVRGGARFFHCLALFCGPPHFHLFSCAHELFKVLYYLVNDKISCLYTIKLWSG